MSPTIISGPVILRPFRQEDIEPLCTHLNNYNVTSLLTVVPFPYNRSDAEAWVHLNQNTDPQDMVNWAIEFDNRLVGTVGAVDLRGETNFGYWLSEECWGKGFTSEAVRAALGYLFEFKGMIALRSGVFQENAASQHILTKMGFQRTADTFACSRARGTAKIPYLRVELTKRNYFHHRTIFLNTQSSISQLSTK